MSSITTAIPSGPISNGPNWCLQDMINVFADPGPPYTYNECANSTKGTEKADFQTFCCDGQIIDTTRNFYFGGNYSTYELDFKNLVCCREGGRLLPGGLSPIDPDHTHCDPSAKPTPLASLAATNTNNAAPYLVTYESGTVDTTGGPADWTVTDMPTCLWIETANKAVSMVNVTVPAAQITTLPPPMTDQFGFTITTASLSDGSGTITTAPSGPASFGAAASTTSAAPPLSSMCLPMLLTVVGLSLSLLII